MHLPYDKYISNFGNNIIKNYEISNYKDKSIYNSNVFEFWAPITNRACPNVIENRYWISSMGNTWNINTHNTFGLSMHKKGYWQVNLMTKDGKQICRKIHRIMMLTFCYFQGCEQYEINHIDGIKTHNYLYNLEWCTHSENTIHAINHNLKTVFGNNYEVLLNDNDITNIINLYNSGYTANQIFDLYKNKGISRSLIENICIGKCRLSYFNNLYNQH